VAERTFHEQLKHSSSCGSSVRGDRRGSQSGGHAADGGGVAGDAAAVDGARKRGGAGASSRGEGPAIAKLQEDYGKEERFPAH
jgi:hypothetical protein